MMALREALLIGYLTTSALAGQSAPVQTPQPAEAQDLDRQLYDFESVPHRIDVDGIRERYHALSQSEGVRRTYLVCLDEDLRLLKDKQEMARLFENLAQIRDLVVPARERLEKAIPATEALLERLR